MHDKTGLELSTLLNQYRALAAQVVQREASVVLLRFESVDDLLQGAYFDALRAAGDFEYRSTAEFIGWLKAVIRGHIRDRREYWFALKRNRGRMLRLTWSALHDSSNHFGGYATTATGPATWAQRREQLTLITKALDALPLRDRDLIRWTSADVDLTEQARRLGLSEDAARRARDRALQRLRKTIALITA